MAVLFAEGFTGVGRGQSSPNAPGAAFILSSLGWTAKCLYNGSTPADVTDTNHVTAVEADPIFATRNRLSAQATIGSTAVSSYIQAYRIPVNTLGYPKVVIGMVFTTYSTTNAANQALQFIISGPGTWNDTGANAPNQFIGLNIPDNGADGISWMFWGAGSAANPLIKKGKTCHIELLIEQDVGRVRAYLDGVLIGDAAWSGTIAAADAAFNIVLRTQAAFVGTYGMKVSDLYVLGLDSVHTAKLGPAARILEIAPPGDMDVHWKRPDGFATNAEVMSQNFDNTSPAYLAASNVGDYDIYSAPTTVAANATQVFGAGIKIRAMTMAPGTHTVKPVVKNGSGVHEVGKETTLTLGTPKPIFSDLSVDPDTNAIWTPAAISAAGLGYKLKS